MSANLVAAAMDVPHTIMYGVGKLAEVTEPVCEHPRPHVPRKTTHHSPTGSLPVQPLPPSEQ